ncbi:hypothetical protein [Lysobacter gummosus]
MLLSASPRRCRADPARTCAIGQVGTATVQTAASASATAATGTAAGVRA